MIGVGADGGGRTHTGVAARGILSPLRLPVPPRPRVSSGKPRGPGWQVRCGLAESDWPGPRGLRLPQPVSCSTLRKIYLDRLNPHAYLRYILRHDLGEIRMHHQRNHDHDWRFARRGFGGFGRGAGPFGPDFRGGRGGNFFRAGKMIADGDLRLICLSLLGQRPRHGYDIIKALEELSSGIYSPSPGVVYPTLTYLEEAGYASAASDGNKKVYSITEAGDAHLAENRELVDSVLKGIRKFGEGIAAA